MDQLQSSRKRKYHCPHCDSYLVKKTFKRHKELYFDDESEQWIRSEHASGNDSEEFEDVGESESRETQPPEVRSHGTDESSDKPPMIEFADSGDDAPDPELDYDDYQESSTNNLSGTLEDNDSAAMPEILAEDEIEVWETEDDLDCFEASDVHTANSQSRAYVLTMWLINVLALLQRKHFIPDAAISLLLKLLLIFLTILSQLYPNVSEIVEVFPKSFYQMQQFLGINQTSFIHYACCQKCSRIYRFDDCIESCGSKKTSRRCVSCNSLLLKTIMSASGKIILRPFRTYCYKSLRDSLQILVNRPSFHDECERWKTRQEEGILKDVQIWKQFQEYNGIPFLSEPFTYGLMINVDWFKVHKHTEYKVGAIYLTIMNLPRELRFRQENVILVGLIPGPKEPEVSVNTFLTPLVNELLEFLEGVQMNVHASTPQTVRCALLCVACDMPASRKLVGFFSHIAKLGCSRCLKQFPGSIFTGDKDYSGFDRSKWPPRTNEEHRSSIKKIGECSQKSKKSQLESTYGCRYSELLRLPYFDPVRMTIIDPMHNLYLGTAKHILKDVWFERMLIKKRDIDVIQKRVDAVYVPYTVGRIPSKIASSFAGFTADQFKNWTNIYSVLSLYDILDQGDFQCWQHFVLASRLLTQPVISMSDLHLADALLIQFCRRVERKYGKNMITPNMHMHGHLKECILDFGPIHNFWCFSFERYNGILENYPTNSSLEVHCMKRFCAEFYVSSASLPLLYKNEFSPVLTVLDPVPQGSLRATTQKHNLSRAVKLDLINDWSITPDMFLPTKYVRSALDQDQISQLENLYSFLYSNMPIIELTLNTVVCKFPKVEYYGTKFESKLSQPGKPNIIYVQQYSPHHTLEVRPVIVHYFVKHSFYYNDNICEHLLMSVSWLKKHTAFGTFGKPLELYWKDLFEPNNFWFIPIQFLVCNCACIDKV